MSAGELPVVTFASRDEWEGWLAEHHTTSRGLWLKFAKKASGIDSVTYPEAVEAALCYGWIDGQRKSFDGSFFLQRFTPRGPRSNWSKINCGKVAELIEAGRIQPAGLREVERAKVDGRWAAAYDSPRSAAVPTDLAEELERNDRAREFFATLSRTNRYAILYRIADAERPDTRARRIAEYVAMLSEGKTTHP